MRNETQAPETLTEARTSMDLLLERDRARLHAQLFGWGDAPDELQAFLAGWQLFDMGEPGEENARAAYAEWKQRPRLRIRSDPTPR